MLLLILFLIFFFTFLIGYQLIDLFSKKILREGVENNESSDNDPDLEKKVEDLSGNVSTLQTQVNGILQSQQEYANQMAPSQPTITGAVN
jgi:cytochrome c-type biogenesis protein CcmH/NrfF